MLLDYTEESQIIVYDMVSGDQFVYNGLAGVSDAFTGLFAELTDLSDLAAPVVRVEAGFDVLEPQVFLMWENPASGIWKATDTFAFTTDGKIIRQNVVLWRSPSSPFFVDRVPSTLNLNTASTGGPTQAGWDNHFAAFGGQNLQQILLDYVQQSQVVVFDIRTGVESVHHALNGVEGLFAGLFGALTDLSDLAAPLVRVEESPQPMVMLVWENPASGIVKATDTFLFDNAGKIIRQNVVVQSESPVHAGGNNHFAAFGGQDVDRILLDYTEQSQSGVQ